MKDIDTAPRINKLKHDIFMKIIDHVEINVRHKISIVLYNDDEIERLMDIQVAIINFFISSHED